VTKGRHRQPRTSRQAARIRVALLAATAVGLAALSVLAAAIVSGCNPGECSDLADQTWVDSSGSGAAIAVASRSPIGDTLHVQKPSKYSSMDPQPRNLCSCSNPRCTF